MTSLVTLSSSQYISALPKIKLYTDETGKFKNDARVTFVNKESVDFAIRYLNNYHFREDCIIHVEEVCVSRLIANLRQARYDPQKYKQRSPVPVTAEEMRKRYLAAKYEQERYILVLNIYLIGNLGCKVGLTRLMTALVVALSSVSQCFQRRALR